jgi:exopolysaccharide production protein ExoZ
MARVKQQPKVVSIQILRAIAVLFVVFHHIYLTEIKYGHGETLIPNFLGLLGASGVDLFFVISGFVMVMVTRGKFARPIESVRFLSSRATRVYPLYWVYSLILLAVFLIRPDLVNSSESNQANILESFLLIPTARLPLLMVGWSLLYEIYFYIVFAILLLFPEKFLVYELMGWAGLVAIANLAALQFGFKLSPIVTLITRPFVFDFVFGGLIASRVHDGKHTASVLALAIGLGMVVCVPSLYFIKITLAFPEEWLRLAIFGIPYALVVYGAVALESGGGVVLLSPLKVIGDASYSIYLSHVFVVTALGRLWGWAAIPGIADNSVVIILMAAAAIIWGLMSYRFLEVPLLAWSRRFVPAGK